MNKPAKIVFLLFCSLFSFFITAFGQTTPPEPDDEFNLFLLSLVVLFICGMIGAAIIGAIVAALILFFLFALVAFGAISSSVAIGIYKRSATAGFKSFLLILFSIACAVIGMAGLFLVNLIFEFGYSNTVVLLIGLVSGIAGGLVLGYATFKVLQVGVKFVLKKLKVLQ